MERKFISMAQQREFEHLQEMVKKLRRTVDLLRQDNESYERDNTRLRHEVNIWMKKSHENLRLSFKGEKHDKQ